MKLLLTAAALLALYLLAIKPRLRKRKKVRRFLGRAYAHRGLHGGAVPENSLAAFKKCGAFGAELDVRLTSDGIPVVIHDADTARTCAMPGKVGELTLEELRCRTLGDGSPVPTLSEALSVLGERRVIVEIKTAGDTRRICSAVLAELERGAGEYIVESFDPRALIWFRFHAGSYIRCQLTARLPGAGRLLGSLLTNVITRPDLIAPRVGEQAVLSLLLCRKLWRTGVIWWTVRDEEKREKLLDRGDSVIFEEKCG